jgi:predicted RNA binding protein YcfA (HicA-like mRNA interferase family)
LGRLANFDAREVRRVAGSLGWQEVHSKGDHVVYRKPGSPLNLSIPDHAPIKEGTMRQLLKTMGLTVDEFLKMARK